MADFTESIVEDAALAWLEALGYAVLQHRDELLVDWRLARESAPLNRIAPLE